MQNAVQVTGSPPSQTPILPICFTPKPLSGAAPSVAIQSALITDVVAISNSFAVACFTITGGRVCPSFDLNLVVAESTSYTVFGDFAIIRPQGASGDSTTRYYVTGTTSHPNQGCDTSGMLIPLTGAVKRCVRFALNPSVLDITQGMDGPRMILGTLGFLGGISTLILGVLGSIAILLKHCCRNTLSQLIRSTDTTAVSPSMADIEMQQPATNRQWGNKRAPST